MPEIGEVARIVHFLRKHLTNKLITSVQVQEDNIVYGKVGTSADAFQKAITGKRVLDARQQGKYFWLVMDQEPHPVMHLGMTGWIKFSKDDSSHYRKQKPDGSSEPEPWPPRFWKFILKTEGDAEIAFVDARRLARIRLVYAPGNDLRNHSPLKENGPDPVIDKDVLTLDWFTTKLGSKKVPVKALLLDQANISGIGNWVADELLYQSRVHPEQRSNEMSKAQIAELYKAMMHVCDTATGTLADSDQFPETWLMKYRWDKGKKDSNVLPNGDKIVHVKVGGRTSAIVPRVQKKVKAGKVVEDDDEEDGVVEESMEEEEKPKRGTKAKKKVKGEDESEGEKPKRAKAKRKIKDEDESEEVNGEEVVQEEEKPAKKRQSNKKSVEADAEDVKPKTEKKEKKTTVSKVKKAAKAEPTTGSRRSGRLSGQGTTNGV